MSTLLLAVVGLLPGPTAESYEKLSEPSDAAPYLAKLGESNQRVWMEGDVLHFARRSANGPVQLTGGLQIPLGRVPGSDLWMVRLRRKDWSRAFISYAFIDSTFQGSIKFEVWRGPSAPQEPPRAQILSRVEHLEVDSKILGEKRKVTVILPPKGVDSQGTIVLADGQGAEAFGEILRALEAKGKIRPMAIIGIHSGGYRGEPGKPFDPKLDMRAREYVESHDPARFKAHLDWVVDELMPSLRSTYGLSKRREDTGVCGFSNGGAFASAAALRRPEIFGVAMPFSVGVPPQVDRIQGKAPRFFFSAGDLEPGFLKGTSAAHQTAVSLGARSEFRTYTAGHDPLMWQIAFHEFIPLAFPAK